APQWDSPRPEDAPVEAPAEPESEGGLELYGEDEATPAAEVAADQPPPEPEPEPEPEPAEESMSERPTVEEIEAERLVSEATEAATLAALSGVSRPGSNTAQPLSLPGGERTLEQVVRDAIAEHLKTWLDANLPTLVERVVREEVRRLADSAGRDALSVRLTVLQGAVPGRSRDFQRALPGQPPPREGGAAAARIVWKAARRLGRRGAGSRRRRDMAELDKTFRPAEVEAKQYDVWERRGAFASDVESNAQPYTIMMPPPNVTGSLHMGHALTFTIQDVLIRWHRMAGRDALWQP
ncbi:valS, partial [Symbiodinium sp. CCMP2456]